MKRKDFLKTMGLGVSGMALSSLAKASGENEDSVFSFPQMVGNINRTTAILQTRLTSQNKLLNQPIETIEDLLAVDIKGAEGTARFEVSPFEDFSEMIKSPWIDADPEQDYILKYRITGLSPNKTYFMRVRWKEVQNRNKTGEITRFSTLPEADSQTSFSFVASSCMSLPLFLLGRAGVLGYGEGRKKEIEQREPWLRPATGEDRQLGYPSLKAILNLAPAFWVQTGDGVYYDHPSSDKYRAKTRKEMRAKWHRQFAFPRMTDVLSRVPTFWMVDDHDYRFNNSDDREENKNKEPSAELGKEIFCEQLPVAFPPEGEDEDEIYRTRAINKHLQIWTMNGRFHRDPNTKSDGPGKSLWGKKQYEWLKKTLLESTATFKVLLVGTPILGPGFDTDRDKHTSYGGFQWERDQFFRWLLENDFLNKNVYFIAGDSHCQFHAIHPTGFEEFATGTLVRQNSSIDKRRLPGDPHSNDPLGFLKVPYIQSEHIGGFIRVVLESAEEKSPTLSFIFTNDQGEIENRVTKSLQ